MVLIGLLGKKHSGKDTAASILISKYDFMRLAFADPLKNICKELFNFSDDQLYNNKETIDDYWKVTPRATFQYLGNDIFRNDINKILPHIGNNFWISSLERKYNEIIYGSNNNKNIVITDVRYQNEVDMIHKNGGIIIKINRPINVDLPHDNHESEIYIDSIENYDYCIDNNGSIENLFKQIIDIVKNILSV